MQLCAPVAKNKVIPPPEVLAFIRFVDLSCYRITGPAVNRTLALRHLNPVLGEIPPADVRVANARQLCVPVQKAGDAIPTDVFGIVRWVDLEKFDIVAPAIPAMTLTLTHLNPVLAHLPPEPATLTARQQLAVPVAKNGMVPPG